MITRILWMGPMVNAETLQKRKAPNQASTKWSWAITNAFTRHGVHIEGIAHCHEQLWPFGKKMWVKRMGWAREDYRVHEVGYLNLPWIRRHSLSWQYRRKIRQVLKGSKPSDNMNRPFDAVLAYLGGDIIEPYAVVVAQAAKRSGIPYFGIVLDGKDPRCDGWRQIVQGTQQATGLVFLSHWMAQNYPGPLPILHCDGGGGIWKGIQSLQKREPNLIVYTGALDRLRGGDFLVEVVRQLKRQDVHIVLCGKSNRKKTWARFRNDSRVEVKGFVSEAELDELCCRASLFLNVRDPLAGDNVVNFPSKVLNYLAYGKPVVSTWVSSFSPGYRDVLEVVEEKDVCAFAQKIEAVLDWSDSEYTRKHEQIRNWYCTEKTWHIQTKRLLEWMNAVCA